MDTPKIRMGTRTRTDYGRMLPGVWLFHNQKATGRAQGWKARARAVESALKSTEILAPIIRTFGIR